MPQSVSLRHAVPPLHVPVLPVPPQVPRPQSALEWHVTELHVPPPQVPRPQPALDVHEITLQVAPTQAPPSQSEAVLHVQVPFWQRRPVPHWLLVVHVVSWHVPVTAPAHVKLVLGQSELDEHGSEHWPMAP
jgi:hypothetical protein